MFSTSDTFSTVQYLTLYCIEKRYVCSCVGSVVRNLFFCQSSELGSRQICWDHMLAVQRASHCLYAVPSWLRRPHSLILSLCFSHTYAFAIKSLLTYRAPMNEWPPKGPFLNSPAQDCSFLYWVIPFHILSSLFSLLSSTFPTIIVFFKEPSSPMHKLTWWGDLSVSKKLTAMLSKGWTLLWVWMSSRVTQWGIGKAEILA